MRAHKSTSAAVRNYFMIFIDLSVSVRGLGLSGSFRKNICFFNMKASHEILSEGHFFGNFIEKFVGIEKKRGKVVQKKE